MSDSLKYQYTIDSRDVIARRDALEEERAQLDPVALANWVDANELAELLKLCKEGETIRDWEQGITLIQEIAFEDYAQELAEEVGLVEADAPWPQNCIDWEEAARELRMDYSSVEFGDVTYFHC